MNAFHLTGSGLHHFCITLNNTAPFLYKGLCLTGVFSRIFYSGRQLLQCRRRLNECTGLFFSTGREILVSGRYLGRCR